MNRRHLFALAGPLALAAGALATGAQAQTQAPAPSKGPPNPLFAEDDEFWFETVRMFGADEYGAGSFGEVLAVSCQIKAGDYDSWYDAWNAAGERLAKEGDGQLARGHKVSARDSFLRASNAYRSSEFFLHANPKDPRVTRAFARQVETYKAAIKLWPTPIEPVEIPYEGKTLPGYLHRVDGTAKKRPLLILQTGFDGSAEEMHWSGAAAAVERGYNVLVFDGPGQSGSLHRDGLTFRPDWEKVITPAVDFALKLKGVDPKKIALMGVSMGGYLAPRAAAFEPRLAAPDRQRRRLRQRRALSGPGARRPAPGVPVDAEGPTRPLAARRHPGWDDEGLAGRPLGLHPWHVGPGRERPARLPR